MPEKRGWGKGDGEREGRRPPRGDGRTKGEELNYLDKGDAYPLSANRVIEPRTFAHSNVASTHSNTRDTRARAEYKPRSKSDNRKFDFSNLAVWRPRKKENDKDR